MGILLEVLAYIKGNWYGILIAGGTVLTAAEFIVRLTPTKKDDGAVERVAKLYDKVFDLLRIPNMRKKAGSIMMPEGAHPKRKK